MTHALHVFDDLQAVAGAASAWLHGRAQAAVAAHGRVTLSLAGGSTPRALYMNMARWQFDWDRAALCFGDERCVPPDHADSNARMVTETLVQPASIAAARIHRMRGELPPDEAARAYGAVLYDLFDGALPRFDVALLGLGADGHTASLFPATEALEERTAWVVANRVPQLQTTRLTLTYPVLNAAHAVAFLVCGGDKAEALRELLEGTRPVAEIPARGIAPAGELLFFVDRAAAARLTRYAGDVSAR